MLHKPASLRKALLAQVPAIKANPEILSMFIDKGKVLARATGSLSFQYRYSLNLVVQDYAGDIDALILPILIWIQQAEPELLERDPHEPIKYESEILDAETADVSIFLDLSERVLVSQGNNGKYQVKHLGDANPAPAFDAESATLRFPVIDPEPAA
ncbi:phage tail protein [Sphingomonas sp.]|jgi:hypothetical protein|uniref:phage tail protein n=1 Tax=Sphingomonas sp. TaxID=28214 RepID=UPI002ED844B1